MPPGTAQLGHFWVDRFFVVYGQLSPPFFWRYFPLDPGSVWVWEHFESSNGPLETNKVFIGQFALAPPAPPVRRMLRRMVPLALFVVLQSLVSASETRPTISLDLDEAALHREDKRENKRENKSGASEPLAVSSVAGRRRCHPTLMPTVLPLLVVQWRSDPL